MIAKSDEAPMPTRLAAARSGVTIGQQEHCQETAMLGLMQHHPLLISGLLDFAARYHGDTEIV
ncbi:MAG: hypothetical protein JXR43_01680, partial [Burkholderiaceae bacterium]|nr:hypothetical protein [Burkholderiaceae bacterium]